MHITKLFRSFWLLGVVLAVMWSSSAPAAAEVAGSKPNIIFILADDMGYGDVGFNGQKHIQTPVLDRMAREGMVFDQHYAGAPVCMPSRTALLTGKHMGHATNRGNPGWTVGRRAVNLVDSDVTVAQELQRAGYHTAIIGKWGLAEGGDDASMPLKRGFDYFYGYRGHGPAHHYYPETLWRNDEEFPLPKNDIIRNTGQYSHDLLTQEALQYVEQRKGVDQPFFLYLAYTIPHKELTVPADSKAPYETLDWPERAMSSGKGKRPYHNDPEGNVAYAGMISRMDRDIGRLLETINANGLAANTLVIFSSDNGPEYDDGQFFDSNGPLRGKKRDLYEGGIRVPTVAYWPGKVPPGVRTDHISAFWDFLPTACELAGVKATDSEIDGISYLPTLLGNKEAQPEHDYLYWAFNERQGPVQAVRARNWKGVRFLGSPVELYDLSKDLGETTNVAAEHPDVVKFLEKTMDEAHEPHPNFPLEKIDRGNRGRNSPPDDDEE